MRAIRGIRRQLHEYQLAQAVETVPGLVVRVADGQHLELGRCLSEEQEQDAVEVTKGLLRERLRLLCGQRFESPQRPAAHDLVRDDLDGVAHTLTQVF